MEQPHSYQIRIHPAAEYRDPYGNGDGKGSESSGEKGTYLFYASKFYISVLR